MEALFATVADPVPPPTVPYLLNGMLAWLVDAAWAKIKVPAGTWHNDRVRLIVCFTVATDKVGTASEAHI